MNDSSLVLVVDDDRMVRTHLKAHLTLRGFEPIEAATAYEAIQIAALRRPPVILLDGLLPQMHGFEVARMVNALDPAYKPQIVIMTGVYKQLHYRNEAKLKYGIAEYLVKPVDLTVLDGILGSRLMAQAS